MQRPHKYDHEICNNLQDNLDFKKFKNECSKIGTTEEALANAEKIGLDTKLFAEHPFVKNKTIPIYIPTRTWNLYPNMKKTMLEEKVSQKKDLFFKPGHGLGLDANYLLQLVQTGLYKI